MAPRPKLAARENHPVPCRARTPPGPTLLPRTLDGPLEESLAGLAGGHAVVVAGGDVPAHEAQALGDGVEHVLALDGRVLHDAAGTVLVALAAWGASQPGAREHGRRVQTVGVGAQGQAEAAAGVGRAAGAVVAEGIDARGRAGRLGLDEGAAAGDQVPVVCGHSVQQPGDTERRSQLGEGAVGVTLSPGISFGLRAPGGRGGWEGPYVKALVR